MLYATEQHDVFGDDSLGDLLLPSRKAVGDAERREIEEMGGLKYEVITDSSRLGAIAAEIARSDMIGLDLETTSLDPHQGRVRILSLNTGFGVYVIDLFLTGGLGPIHDALHNPEAQTGRGRPLVVAQNLKFDQKWLWHHFKLLLWPIFDTYRASVLLHNGRRRDHDLVALYSRELDKDDVVDQMGAAGWSGSLSARHYAYAAEDVTYLPTLKHRLRTKLQRAGLLQTAMVEFRAVRPESQMEVNGFRLDPDAWLALAEENTRKAAELRIELLHALPHPNGQLGLFDTAIFNVDSNQQVQQAFLRMGYKLEDTKRTTLAMYAGAVPEVDLLMRYREYSKKCSAFGEKYLKHLNPVTGRIHASYYPFTGAGRYACSKPNLQQIPRTNDFRACFRPDPGKKLIVCDYSQIELRLVAQISGDSTLIKLYREGVDVHKYTASVVCGVPMDQVTKAQRQLAKPINFGLIYGLMPAKLVMYARANYGVNMTEKEAKAFWNRYFETYQGIRSWQERTIEIDKPRRQSRTLLGRRRFIDKESEHNAFYNTPVQGSGADGLKNALWFVHHRLLKYEGRVKLVHMVHDEIVLEADDDPDLLAAAKKDLELGMLEGMQPILKDVPIIADADVGDSWAEAK